MQAIRSALTTFEEYPRTYRYEKFLPWVFGAGILLGSSIAIDNIATEQTRCLADNPEGWVDVNILECDDVIQDFISR